MDRSIELAAAFSLLFRCYRLAFRLRQPLRFIHEGFPGVSAVNRAIAGL
ncbi:TPA: hypothetical protein NWA32_004210 [Escherichia coli]|nr:hypothetical protein [Escherichia coli]